MDICTFGFDGDTFEASRTATESECAFVVDAQPDVSRAIGQHTTSQQVATPHLRLYRPTPLNLTVGPQHKFVIACHPEASIFVGTKGINRTELSFEVAIVEQVEFRTLGTDEIDTRAVIAHPNVAVFILHQATCIKR